MFNKKLLLLLGDNKFSVAIIVFLNILALILNLGILFSVCHVFDALLDQYRSGSFSIDGFYIHFIMAGLFSILRFALTIVRSYVCAHYEKIVKKGLVDKVLNKVNILANNEIFPQIKNMSITSIEQVGTYLFKFVPTYLFTIISPLILALITLLFCKEASLVLIVFLPLVLLCYFFANRYSKRYFAIDSKKYSEIKDSFQDNVKGIKELKVYQADENYQEKMNSDVEIFKANVSRGIKLQSRVVLIVNLLIYLGIALGIITLLVHNESVGNIGYSKEISMIFILLLAPNFLAPLKTLGTLYHASMEGYISGTRICDFLELPEPIWGNDEIDDPTVVELKNISFSYPGYDELIHDVSLKAKKGEVVAIVGKSDSGKSALLSMILGVRKNYGGEITIGGKDIRTISKESISSNISYISDETSLFRISIRENFRNMNEDITDDEIYQLLEKVQLKDLIESKGGIGVVIGSPKLKLLKGQKARLKLAINLASTKPIYLIDDLSKKSDVESENIILNVISNIGKDKMVIMISSRVRCCEIAKKIYVIDDGYIVEKGTAASLKKTKGTYKNLYTSQSALEGAYKGGDIDE